MIIAQSSHRNIDMIVISPKVLETNVKESENMFSHHYYRPL